MKSRRCARLSGCLRRSWLRRKRWTVSCARGWPRIRVQSLRGVRNGRSCIERRWKRSFTNDGSCEGHMKIFSMLVTSLVLVVLPACSSTEKPKPRVPLPVSSSVPQAVITATQQGTRAFQGGQYQEAKTQFELAVAGAPNSAEAHYDLGLALFALGEVEQAREQFMEAA